MHFELLLHDKKEEGRREGRQEGLREGRQKGRHEERVALIKTLMESMNLSVENAMAALKIPPAQWEYYKKQIQSS